MQIFMDIIFFLGLALLFVHEMDAIQNQEWKMFIVLKDMEDEKAYRVFTLLHIPLYAAILYLLFSRHTQTCMYIVDGFLIAHLLIHILFRKHPNNKLDNVLSKSIICGAGLIAIVHLLILIFSNAFS